jgi:hypothetical protein
MNKEFIGICLGAVAAIAAVVMIPEVCMWSCCAVGEPDTDGCRAASVSRMREDGFGYLNAMLYER